MKKFFSDLLSFNGQIQRSQYWGTLLGNIVAAYILAFFGGLLIGLGATSFGFLVVAAVTILAVWVSIATIVKRCRDCDMNPWWTLATLIPFIGWIVAVVIGCLETKTPKVSQ